MLRVRDWVVLGAALVAFAWPETWDSLFGQGPRVVPWLGLAAVLLGMPTVAVASSRPAWTTWARRLSLLAPGIALVWGRDVAEARSVAGLDLALGFLLVLIWAYLPERASTSAKAHRASAVAWLFVGAAPALAFSVLVQAAPESWSRAAESARLAGLCVWTPLFELCQGMPAAPVAASRWALAFGLSVAALALVEVLARTELGELGE